MSQSVGRTRIRRRAAPCIRRALAATCVLAGSGTSAVPQGAVGLVPVHVVIPTYRAFTQDIVLSGEIQARIQSSIAFRLTGKVTARRVEVGEHVTADQVLATLDPTEQKADVDNAEAGLNSAEALLQQATTSFERQKSLIASGYTTQASFDSAQESLKTTQAQVDIARAALSTSKEQLSYANLKSGVDGIVVSRDVETGQVVQAGQTVFVIAQDGPRDAVFNIFEALLTKPPKSRTVDVVLQSDSSVKASGDVREISPTVDATTSTVKVKIGLTATPPQMTLGAAVVGKARWEQTSAMVLPWSALFEWEGKPAIWVVDEADVVSLKTIEIASYATGSVVLAGGLDGKQRVVTTGIQLLHPGQKVAVVEGGGL
jgi:RND family efflux transporter MFP subunit